jgi:hypothetical protein
MTEPSPEPERPPATTAGSGRLPAAPDGASAKGSERTSAAASMAGDEPAPATAAWVQAEAHALAAAALLDDPSVPPWTAAEHLRRGFSALARAAGVERPEPAAALDPSTLPWLGAPQAVAEPLRRLGTDDDTTLEPAALRRLGSALATAVATAADARFAPTRRLDRRRRLLRRVLMGVLVFIPVVVGLVLTVPDFREGPWRGQYFANVDFEGEPIVVRREGDVKFEWKRMSPTPELPDDAFSVRYDTCMELPEDLEIAFQLISDDGSRLFVDGELVLDNWGRHGERSRGADVPVAAGLHHVRVEYFDDRHGAMVELRASLHGELPDSLPVRLLHHPGDDFDEADPCAAVPR